MDEQNDRTILEDIKNLKGWLIILSGEWESRDLKLYGGRNIIGSDPYSDLYLPISGIEKFHFSMRFTGDKGFLTDLDSESGLFINDNRVYREKISDEMVFKAGEIFFLIKVF